MNKVTNFVLGALTGATIGLLIYYLFSPIKPSEAEDGIEAGRLPYQSRLRAAIDAGQRAAAEREADLWRNFEEAKQRH